MSATPTTPVAPRIRAQVVEELVQMLNARAGLKGEERKPVQAAIQALEVELLSAPLQPANASKGVVNIVGVLEVLQAQPGETFTPEQLAVGTGHEATAAVKARIVHWARREGATEHGILEQGPSGRRTYSLPAPTPEPTPTPTPRKRTPKAEKPTQTVAQKREAARQAEAARIEAEDAARRLEGPGSESDKAQVEGDKAMESDAGVS